MKLSKWVEYTAECERCGIRDRDDGARGVYTTLRQATEGARKHGWRVVKGKTLCPDCQDAGKTSE